MKEEIVYADLKIAEQHEVARQLALEKWMEEVSKFVRQHKYLGVRDVDSALEEYKRVSKP